MNLLYLHTHDMGRYNGVYGYNIYTPAMQSVADDGILFRNAHCACPTCSPSRGALLTGQMPHVNGLMGLAHRGSDIRDKTHHLAYFMTENHYHTALIGVQHELNGDARALGYQTVVALRNTQKGNRNLTDNIAETAAHYIKNEIKEPFFLSVGFGTTHREYVPHQIDPDYVQVPSCLPDNAETRSDYADYITSCELLDKAMGIVLQALKDKGLYEDTLILLTTDHGIAFPFMKCHLYDTGTGVSLIIKPAQNRPATKCTDALVSQIDVFPTICDMMDLPHPDWLEGVSMKPLIDGTQREVREKLFTEITFHAAYEPVRAIRTQRYKYILHFDREFTNVIMPNIDDGQTKQFLMQKGLADRKVPREELYDLYFDPNERHNLCDVSQMKAVKESLSAKLFAWMKQTADPILSGSLQKYPGQLLNPREDTQPSLYYESKDNIRQ